MKTRLMVGIIAITSAILMTAGAAFAAYPITSNSGWNGRCTTKNESHWSSPISTSWAYTITPNGGVTCWGTYTRLYYGSWFAEGSGNPQSSSIASQPKADSSRHIACFGLFDCASYWVVHWYT